MLKLENVSVSYGSKVIVDNYSLEISKGEAICIVGPNGVGKSTLSKAIANTISFDGKISHNGIEIKNQKRRDIGKTIGFLTQSNSIYFPFSVWETVETGRYVYKDENKINDGLKKAVDEAIAQVGLTDLRDNLIDTLSGGQLQRVYLARLLVQNPDVIIMDEPTNNLDFKYQLEILDFVSKWTKEQNKICIIVMHDLNLVQKYADRVLLMKSNKEYEFGNVKDVLTTENLNDVYGIDVKKWMKEVLNLWEE